MVKEWKVTYTGKNGGTMMTYHATKEDADVAAKDAVDSKRWNSASVSREVNKFGPNKNFWWWR